MAKIVKVNTKQDEQEFSFPDDTLDTEIEAAIPKIVEAVKSGALPAKSAIVEDVEKSAKMIQKQGYPGEITQDKEPYGLTEKGKAKIESMVKGIAESIPGFGNTKPWPELSKSEQEDYLSKAVIFVTSMGVPEKSLLKAFSKDKKAITDYVKGLFKPKDILTAAASKLGKPNELTVLDKIVVAGRKLTEDEKLGAIVKDALQSDLVAAEAFKAKNKIPAATEALSKARKNLKQLSKLGNEKVYALVEQYSSRIDEIQKAINPQKDSTIKKMLAPLQDEIGGVFPGRKKQIEPKLVDTVREELGFGAEQVKEKIILVQNLYDTGKITQLEAATKLQDLSRFAGKDIFLREKPRTTSIIKNQKGSLDLGNFPKALHELHESYIKPLKFYSDIPKELRNDMRSDVIGGMQKVLSNRDELNKMLKGNKLSQTEKGDIMEYLAAKDEVARATKGIGTKGVTLQDAQHSLNLIEPKVVNNPKLMESIDTWTTVRERMTQDLLDRGKISPASIQDDYLPHWVIDYSPDNFYIGIPSRLRTSYRGYTKQAKGGSEKEIRKDFDLLLDHVSMVQTDNIIDDFLIKQANKYDEYVNIADNIKFDLFGTTPKGKPGTPKAGHLYRIGDEKYWGFNPNSPFTRSIYSAETAKGETVAALGKQTKTYLVPEKIYNFFQDFSPKSNKFLYDVNQITRYWKSAAILSHYPSFNINNMIGDTIMATTQHPEPLKLLKNVDDFARFLAKKKSQYTPKDVAFAKFLSDQDIVSASFIHELPRSRGKGAISKGLKVLLKGSEIRESLLRGANAKYLFDELAEGRGADIAKKFNWFNMEDLTDETKIAGEIGRKFLIDYNETSKIYRNVIKNGLFPFGHWYFKGSEQTLKWLWKHPFKASAVLSSLPLASVAWNYADEDHKKLEMELSPEIRESLHFVYGKKTPEGKIKVLKIQSPFDALIGTKVFTIIETQLAQAANGEKSLDEAITDSLKDTLKKEAKGIAFLTTPWVRLVKGLIKGVDPYDNTAIYPSPIKSQMTDREIYTAEAKYFFKTMVPVMSAYLMEAESKKQPAGVAVKEVLENFAGYPAFGFREYNPETRTVTLDGEERTWKDVNEIEEWKARRGMLLRDTVDKFVKSGKAPIEFYRSEDFTINYNKLVKHYGSEHPKIQAEIQKDLQDRIGLPTDTFIQNVKNYNTVTNWLENKIATADNDEDKKMYSANLRAYKEALLKKKLK